MWWVRQRYRDISPVILQLGNGASGDGTVSSSLYCREVEGLPGGLVESFLVELYRCKLCQFTCCLRTSISSHLLLRHRPFTPPYLGEEDEREAGKGGEEEPQQEAAPYQLDLNEDNKQSDEDEDFLLYNILEDMSPSGDISGGEGLQVAHTCEVSTLFEEDDEAEHEQDSPIFPLKSNSVDLSCPMAPPATQEEMAQSAHLMTLGLCRISSAVKPAPPTSPHQPLPPPSRDSVEETGTHGPEIRATPSGRDGLPCPLCPLTLPSRRLLDVHNRSHEPAGGFRCVCCSCTTDSWEELEPHWRSHSRTRRRVRSQQEDRRRRRKRARSHQEDRRRRKKAASHTLNQQTDHWKNQKMQDETEGVLPNRGIVRSQTVPRQSTLKTKTKVTEQMERDEGDTSADSRQREGLGCSLCHRKFSSKVTLRRHLGVHRGDKPHTCLHCSYSSRLKASLLQHLRTHTGEKPYRCAECAYASIDRSSLLRHSRTHSKDKPYRCRYCDYSSIQKKSLDLHTRRQHTGEAFPCQQCDYASPDPQLLQRHVRRHHGPEPLAAL